MKVAVIGASNDRSKFGNKAVRAYVSRGHEVVPINLHEETIEGLKVKRSVADVDPPPDRIAVYVAPDTTLQLLDEIAVTGALEIFLNPGTESPEVVARARTLGISPILDCAIVAIGESPANY